MKRLVLVSAALLLLAGCHGKAEAVAVISAVDAYRAASNEDKPKKAAALDAIPCTDEDVCAAKDACRRSADATAKGLRLQTEIEAAAEDGGTRDPSALQKKFEESNSELAEGYGFLAECTTKLEALKQHYGL